MEQSQSMSDSTSANRQTTLSDLTLRDASQIYTSIQFLIFDLEKALGIEIDDSRFIAYMSNRCYMNKNGSDRLYAPYLIKIGREKYDLDRITALLHHIPLIPHVISKDRMELNFRNKLKESVVRDDEKVSKAEQRLKQLSLLAMREAGGAIEPTDTVIIDLLKKYEVNYKEENGLIVLPDQKIVITNISLILLPNEYKDYECIHDGEHLFYNSICGDKRQGPVEALGYYTRVRETKTKLREIAAHAEDHIAIIDDEGIFDLMM